MNTLKIAFLFCFLSTIFIQCTAQNNSKDTDDINTLKKEAPNEMIMMSARVTETGQIADQLWLIASTKGKKDGLLVKHPRATKWTELDSKIDLFKYEEGFEYKIMLTEESFNDDKKAPKYTLTRVLDKKKKNSDIRTAQEQGTFENTTWYFTHFEGKKVKDGYIHFSENGIGASVGCNSLGGMLFKTNAKKNTIKFTNGKKAIMTCMACGDNAMMKREDRLIPLLQAVTSYEATPEKLILKDEDKILMILKR